MQETRVSSLGWETPLEKGMAVHSGIPAWSWETPLEKGMAVHSGIPAWRIPWTEKPGRLQSVELQRVGHD